LNLPVIIGKPEIICQQTGVELGVGEEFSISLAMKIHRFSLWKGFFPCSASRLQQSDSARRIKALAVWGGRAAMVGVASRRGLKRGDHENI
jgi:hypothetical protein